MSDQNVLTLLKQSMQAEAAEWTGDHREAAHKAMNDMFDRFVALLCAAQQAPKGEAAYLQELNSRRYRCLRSKVSRLIFGMVSDAATVHINPHQPAADCTELDAFVDGMLAVDGHSQALNRAVQAVAAGHFRRDKTNAWHEVPRHMANQPGVVILYHAAAWPQTEEPSDKAQGTDDSLNGRST